LIYFSKNFSSNSAISELISIFFPTFITDSNRVLKIIDKVLNALEKRNIDYVIVDIGAIHDINSEVARQIIKLNKAIHYMGSIAYLTGITPEIAKSLTHLDIHLGDIKTFSTTQKAMEVIIGKSV